MANDTAEDYEIISAPMGPSYETIDLSSCRTVPLSTTTPCGCNDKRVTGESPAGVMETIRLDDVSPRDGQSMPATMLEASWYDADRGIRLPPDPLEGKGTFCQWTPNLWQPVFWGIEDHFPGTARLAKGSLAKRMGPPTRLRILYPSVDIGQNAPLLDEYGPYPLIVFSHGQCLTDPDIFLRWTDTLIPLARSGYIVVAPRVPYLGSSPNLDAAAKLLVSVVEWMQQHWEHKAAVGAKLGVAGHSYGGVATLNLVVSGKLSVNAFAALSGAFEGAAVDSSLAALSVPSLFMAGVAADNGAIQGKNMDPLPYAWKLISSAKHGVVFAQGRHYDYIPIPAPQEVGTDKPAACHDDNSEYTQGACHAQWLLARDMLVTFFSRYMPPTILPKPFTTANEHLLPPALTDLQTLNQTLVLTDQCKANHEFFFGGHMGGRTAFAGAADCGAKVLWQSTTFGVTNFP